MTELPAISPEERYWNAEIARRRPDLVAQEAGTLERMTERYLDLTGSPLAAVGSVLPDRARVLRHLIDEAGEARDDSLVEAAHQLGAQVGAWTESQVERLAELIRSHRGARADIMGTGDGAIVVSFGPRRGNGAYTLDRDGRSRWVTPARYTA